ncbi:MAG TPA: hypothetical protein VNX02_17975 [Steroidobacteraceae bacterium]|jgi:hypothetical protein|nr:hypothetical protein [Steroidobacteraceae bacterium]
MDPKLITPILIGALVVWGVLRRARRSFGRQPVQVARMMFRIIVLTLVGGIIFATGVTHNPQALAPLLGGAACGAALGYLGLRHTRFEVTPEGRFYTPHTYIGLAVMALFLGRLLYRMLYLYGTGASPGADPNLTATYQRNPLTLGIFAVLIVYYLVFYAGVLVRTRPGGPPASAGDPTAAKDPIS